MSFLNLSELDITTSSESNLLFSPRSFHPESKGQYFDDQGYSGEAPTMIAEIMNGTRDNQLEQATNSGAESLG